MFVFSFKASKFRVLFAVVLCALIAFTAIVLLPETEHSVTVNGVQFDRKIRFDGIKSTDDLAAFAENLGYAVDASPVESVNVKLPSKFDAVLEKYNDIQKSQGFNLAKYKNKEVVRHTFRVTALPMSKRCLRRMCCLPLSYIKIRSSAAICFSPATKMFVRF